MNDFKKLFGSILILAFVGCSSSEEFEINTISGTYFGTLKSNVVNKSSSLTTNNDFIAEVKTKGNQLEVNCYGEDMDLTFMLDYFEHSDSIMVCLTGNDYKNLYGHAHGEGMMTGNDMNNMPNGNTEWMRHLSNAHDPDDDHFFGGFDHNHHSFTCTFIWQDEVVTFRGLKQ